MKICIVNEFFKPFRTGGVDIFLEGLIDYLISKGMEVKLITSRVKNTLKYEKENSLEIFRIKSSPIQIGHFQQIPGLTLPFNFFNYNLMPNIRSIIEDVDCVHINNLYHLSFTPLQIAKKLRKQIILDIHDYWPICFRKDLLYSGEHLCSHNNPINCYHCLSLSNPALLPFCFPIIFEFFLRNRLIKTKNVVVHSMFVSDKIMEYTKMKSLVIPYPYIGKIKKRIKKLGDKIKILFMGRLQLQKGAHLLPIIAKKLEENDIDYEINVLGDGVLYNMLKNSTEKENLNIKFFGFVQDKQTKNRFLENTDILLFPSIWYEPFGITALEAMAFGTPVIGSNLGGLGELISKNNIGFFTTPNPNTIVECIKSLKDSPKLYKKFSANAVRHIGEYSQRNIFDKYLSVFESSNL